jgi:Na+/H+ antiporter NhaD/arsenite permease-like protein
MSPTAVTLGVFALVYLGMLLGRLPRLQLDRTGVALLGAIALVAAGVLTIEEAARAVDLPTIALLFALMVLSAQLRLGGFYGRVAAAVTTGGLDPPRLLLAVVLLAGALAAVFTNDIVCLAVAPVLIDSCRRRGLDPVPFLLGLACAANVGSAATVIGNPQNILIGETFGLTFAGYLADAGVPAAVGLVATWAVIARQQRGRWAAEARPAAGAGGEPHVAAAAAFTTTDAAPAAAAGEPHAEFDRWQTAKGLVVTAALVVAFLVTPRRDLVALAAAGVLLCSRRLHSRRMLGLVDWQLLVLFCGLFVVNHALEATGVTGRALAALGAAGIDPGRPGWLFALTVALSNTVSNVPAVMLLAPIAAGMPGGYPLAGPLLALTSTLAGNLLIVGSIANLIVADAAARHGIEIGWRRHARTGLPVTLVTLALALAWLWLRGAAV